MSHLACSLFLVATAALATGCTGSRSLLVSPPDDARLDRAVTAMWTHQIQGVARDGDWLLTRSYYALGDVIAKLTPGVDLSHASIYDAARDTVIEAVGDGVREIPLSELIARNHYVLVVRPAHMTAAEQRASLERARGQLGAAFDKTGMLGFDDPAKFYCSELVWWASEMEQRSGERERIVTPVDLLKYGEVIYWSGERTDRYVMKLASSRVERKMLAATSPR